MTLLFTRILPSVFNHKQVESRGFINPQYLLEKRENLKNFNQNSPSMRGPAYDLIHHYQIQFAVLASSLHLPEPSPSHFQFKPRDTIEPTYTCKHARKFFETDQVQSWRQNGEMRAPRLGIKSRDDGRNGGGEAKPAYDGRSPATRADYSPGVRNEAARNAWTTVANSAAMRRTHIWQRRYQSRSDDWLCIGACAGTPRERVEMAVEEVGGLVANPLVPGMKRLLRGGIIHQGGSFLSLPACHSLSFPLSLRFPSSLSFYCDSYALLSWSRFHFFHRFRVYPSPSPSFLVSSDLTHSLGWPISRRGMGRNFYLALKLLRFSHLFLLFFDVFDFIPASLVPRRESWSIAAKIISKFR